MRTRNSGRAARSPSGVAESPTTFKPISSASATSVAMTAASASDAPPGSRIDTGRGTRLRDAHTALQAASVRGTRPARRSPPTSSPARSIASPIDSDGDTTLVRDTRSSAEGGSSTAAAGRDARPPRRRRRNEQQRSKERRSSVSIGAVGLSENRRGYCGATGTRGTGVGTAGRATETVPAKLLPLDVDHRDVVLASRRRLPHR